MNNVYMLIGEEITLKSLRINQLISALGEHDYKSIHVEPYRTKNYNSIIDSADIFLGTYDFFNNAKVLKITVFKPEQVDPILNGINMIGDNCILIIDLRCPEFLSRKIIPSFNKKNFAVESFFAFKDYEKEKVFSFIRNTLDEFNLSFDSNEDLVASIDYLLKNSQNSYDTLYNEIKKLRLLEMNNLKYEDVTAFIGTSSSQNKYKVCDYLFKANDKKEMIDNLEMIMYSSSSKFLCSVIDILIEKIHDYIRLSNKRRCNNRANYYLLRESRILIPDADLLIIRLSNLSLLMKEDRIPRPEEFLWILIEFIEFK